MELRVLGSGDAFGSGGRLHTCFHVRDRQGAFLVDCGASAMIAIRRFGVDPNGIRAVLVSHLHGDHFGGLPFFILDAQLISRRSAPLIVAGPPGLEQRLHAAMEVLFPGSASAPRRFEVVVRELAPRIVQEIAGIAVTPYVVKHASGAPPFALRMAVDDKVLCYSGDTEWVDDLGEAARGADLFIAESYVLDRPVRYHLDFATLARHLPAIGARRVLLTHMSADMLARVGEAGCETAEDGMVLTI
jgi:ribonuclease BN (tRNA processing enzyme)